MKTLAAFVALGASALALRAEAADIGACAWAQQPQPVRTAFVNAFGVAVANAMQVLSDDNSQIALAVTSCSKRADLPPQLWQAAVGSVAIQDGAAHQLLARGISKATLEAAWREAPRSAAQCARANAAKVFGVTTEACPDPRASLWFLSRLKISPQSDRAAAQDALVYFNAKAQDEWAETLIARQSGASAADPAQTPPRE